MTQITHADLIDPRILLLVRAEQVGACTTVPVSEPRCAHVFPPVLRASGSPSTRSIKTPLKIPLLFEYKFRDINGILGSVEIFCKNVLKKCHLKSHWCVLSQNC